MGSILKQLETDDTPERRGFIAVRLSIGRSPTP
ncbi:hypothetical protein KNU94_gp30 [Xanthomonas phage FoX2]|uniref:Uncharacterized protein n=2 Tax=Foxunavirus TaxID=2948712 RepID=A0A858NMV2_9CAUD|nr:hypothetical protein KNU94_gp30 [Xanthomonas phage FoX2]YP_010106895.1 hypothetical protein KNU96_gp30 [Xanthomonas phage FoX5]QJB21849.1 hypothetical protein XccvBFoX2_gp30 [Xanthomonas phage FoX2]QJB22008.1 hypothetical protein XccvBFoX5_gp30 [Xanthomonas phage FoX5]